MLCARCCSKHLAEINLLTCHSNPTEQAVGMIPNCRRGNRQREENAQLGSRLRGLRAGAIITVCVASLVATVCQRRQCCKTCPM